MAIADHSTFGALDPRCIRLAKLSRIAVDFPKTGIPAVMPTEIIPEAYPDCILKQQTITTQTITTTNNNNTNNDNNKQ